jgi:hypothetical protein
MTIEAQLIYLFAKNTYVKTLAMTGHFHLLKELIVVANR